MRELQKGNGRLSCSYILKALILPLDIINNIESWKIVITNKNLNNITEQILNIQPIYDTNDGVIQCPLCYVESSDITLKMEDLDHLSNCAYKVAHKSKAGFGTWDFVENNYPDYENSSEMYKANILRLILKNEWENNETATEIFQNEYNGDMFKVQDDFYKLYRHILKTTIATYIKKKKIDIID